MPGETRHNARNRALNAAVYEDLGLAESITKLDFIHLKR
jgi:hypothetical protein